MKLTYLNLGLGRLRSLLYYERLELSLVSCFIVKHHWGERAHSQVVLWLQLLDLLSCSSLGWVYSLVSNWSFRVPMRLMMMFLCLSLWMMWAALLFVALIVFWLASEGKTVEGILGCLFNKRLFTGTPVEILVIIVTVIDHYGGTFKFLLPSRYLAVIIGALWLFRFTNCILPSCFLRVLEIHKERRVACELVLNLLLLVLLKVEDRAFLATTSQVMFQSCDLFLIDGTYIWWVGVLHKSISDSLLTSCWSYRHGYT